MATEVKKDETEVIDSKGILDKIKAVNEDMNKTRNELLSSRLDMELLKDQISTLEIEVEESKRYDDYREAPAPLFIPFEGMVVDDTTVEPRRRNSILQIGQGYVHAGLNTYDFTGGEINTKFDKYGGGTANLSIGKYWVYLDVTVNPETGLFSSPYYLPVLSIQSIAHSFYSINKPRNDYPDPPNPQYADTPPPTTDTFIWAFQILGTISVVLNPTTGIPEFTDWIQRNHSDIYVPVFKVTGTWLSPHQYPDPTKYQYSLKTAGSDGNVHASVVTSYGEGSDPQGGIVSVNSTSIHDFGAGNVDHYFLGGSGDDYDGYLYDQEIVAKFNHFLYHYKYYVAGWQGDITYLGYQTVSSGYTNQLG